ncbi:hypothetical protein LLG95_03000 [bacterium]|nr:hypothetical protein [bacterium]
MIVKRMSGLKKHVGLSLRAQCLACAVAYSSLMRWKGRIERGEPAVRRPGPAKGRWLDWNRLNEEIIALSHGRHRTAGTGALYRRNRDCISRRDLMRVIHDARARATAEARASKERIDWLKAGVVWSMDDLEISNENGGGKLHVHAVEDVGARFKMPPLVGTRLADGQAVAEHLDSLFRRFGAPLFLKRDNHGNLNGGSVDEVMARALVLPLNSPPYYPPYNGAMERAQREIKEEFVKQLGENGGAAGDQLVERAADRLNHRPRPCLGRQTPCAVFSLGCQQARIYTRRKRREVCAWIESVAAQIVEKSQSGPRRVSAAQAWRLAAQHWMEQNGIIKLARG